MGKAEIEKQKQEALRARLAKKMLETQSEATPFPDKLTTLADWQCVDWTCAGDKRLLKKTLDDVPMQTDFVRDNETPNATQLHTFIRWRIKSAEDSAKSKKRTAEREAEKALKRLRGERPLDQKLFGDDVEAWEAAMEAAAWDNDKKRVMDQTKFVKRGGSPAFWRKLKDRERAAKVRAAEVAELLRRSYRERRATKFYDPAAVVEQAGGVPGDSSYPHIGLEKDETVCRIILGEGGEEALKALGIDWVCGAWQSETALDLKLRGLMEQLSRILTIGAVTTKVHVDHALAALERELERRLAAWYASLGAAPVAPLGASNHGDASSAPAACVGAAAADGADVRGGAPSRDAAQTACGGAASALGGDAKTPSRVVLLAAAAARRLDLVRLVLDANKDVRTGAARFAGDASDASTAARSADRLTSIARRASPDLKDKHAIRDALDGLSLRDTQFGLLGLTLLRAGFVTYDPTGKAVDGAPIQRMRACVAGLAGHEEGAGAKFYLHQVILVSVQLAFTNELLDFERMRLSLFQCVFGRYLLALWAWLNGLTASSFKKMKLPLNMVVVEFTEDEVKLLPPAVADAFKGGITFETAADLLTAHQNANTAFAAGKNRVFVDGGAAWRDGAAGIVSALLAAGAELSDSAAARGSALAMDIDDAEPLSAEALRAAALALDGLAAGLAKLCGGKERNGDLMRFCAATLNEPAAGSVLALVDAALAVDDPTSIKRATRIVVEATAAEPRFNLDTFLKVVIETPPPPEMTFECDIRFHEPGVGGYTDWRSVSDFCAVYEALRVHIYWSCVPAWVLVSPTYLAFEASGQQILAGMTLKEMTDPRSIRTVFDQEECEGTRYGTYTIFCGSDYQLRVRGRAPVDKCACIVDAVKAHMASRAAA